MPRFVRPRVQDINLTHKPPLFMHVLTIPASKCIFRVGRITQGGALTPYGIIINRHAKARQHPRSHMHKPTNLDIRPTYPVNSVPYLAPRPEDCAARLAVLMEDPDVAKFCESLSAALEAASRSPRKLSPSPQEGTQIRNWHANAGVNRTPPRRRTGHPGPIGRLWIPTRRARARPSRRQARRGIENSIGIRQQSASGPTA